MSMSFKLTMKLNHISIPTQDVGAEARFFEEYFGAKTEFVGPSGSILLKHGDIDIVIDAVQHAVQWDKEFHFGLELATKSEVESLYDHFKRSGVRLETEVFNRIGRGSRFFGRTPAGVQFEINTREDMDERWDVAKN